MDQKSVIFGSLSRHSDFMKNSTSPIRNHHFQRSEPPKIDQKSIRKRYRKKTSIFRSIVDGFGIDFGSFSIPKIDQNRYQFRDRFLEGFKFSQRRLGIRACSSRPATKDTFGVLTGLHSVVQLSGGLGLWNRGLVLGSYTPCAGGTANFRKAVFMAIFGSIAKRHVERAS